MALLDVALRTLGLTEGERLFPLLRDLAIAIDLPHDLVVMKGLSKIRRPVESKDAQKKEETREGFEARLREKEATSSCSSHWVMVKDPQYAPIDAYCFQTGIASCRCATKSSAFPS